MTTDSDRITEQIPAATRVRRAPHKKRTKRHPAAASRILAAGLATASTFGLVAVVGNRAQATEAAAPVVETSTTAPVTTGVPTTAPPPVVVVRRTYVHVDGSTSATPSRSGGSGATSATPAAPVQRAAPVTAAPRRTAPATTSSSS